MALSFAGAQRDYVGRVAAALEERGVRCFYDADRQVDLWGKHLAEELPRIYAEESAAVVVFISADYAGRDWTRLERRAAFSRAVAEAGVYVLPARFDDSELPGLLPDVVTVDLRRYTPEQFAGLVAEKVAGLAGGPRAGTGLAATGRPLAEVTDPFALEVHRPVLPEHPQPGLPELPPYVPREHDQVLAEVVRAAVGGRSGIAALVGGSSTGKTRACWEALALLRDQDPPWRLWHPIDPTRPDAAVRELPRIGPRTVVWLNEAQFYLDPAEAGLGERVAAGLRELLRDPGRAPVLVLATVWPGFWSVLTARPPEGAPDPHAQARELLAGHDITVPAAFTPAQMSELARAADVRMVMAARSARDREVIQFLAGAPELLARYRNAPPAAAALIGAAMDARRLGMGAGLPRAFLEAAAPGYLTDPQWDALGEDWLEQALAYTAIPCNGARGPLTRIRSRPVHAAGRRSRAGSTYLLADYLEQHGRSDRREQIPPADFWAAAGRYADLGDLEALAEGADNRGLYRDAAQLRKHATAGGDTFAAAHLVSRLHVLNPADQCPARWCVVHARLDNPRAVANLLDSLQRMGVQEQVAALLARDPAAHVSLDNPLAVKGLLDSLREAGANEQAAALADRAAAAHVSLDWQDDAGFYVPTLDRDPAHVSLDDTGAVAWLLDSLRRAGADEQAAALLARDPGAHVSLGSPGAVAGLLDSLQRMGAQEQVAALLARDPAAHVSLDNPLAVKGLLNSLQRMGANEQAAGLADRAVAQVRLDDLFAVTTLLDGLRRVGAQEQVAALLARDPAGHARLDDAGGVNRLLGGLREAGASEQVAALLARDPAAHVSLEHWGGVHLLLAGLRAAGAGDQVTALADRFPGAGWFREFCQREGYAERFRFGREADGSPAGPWGWEDLD